MTTEELVAAPAAMTSPIEVTPEMRAEYWRLRKLVERPVDFLIFSEDYEDEVLGVVVDDKDEFMRLDRNKVVEAIKKSMSEKHGLSEDVLGPTPDALTLEEIYDILEGEELHKFIREPDGGYGIEWLEARGVSDGSGRIVENGDETYEVVDFAKEY